MRRVHIVLIYIACFLVGVGVTIGAIFIWKKINNKNNVFFDENPVRCQDQLENCKNRIKVITFSEITNNYLKKIEEYLILMLGGKKYGDLYIEKISNFLTNSTAERINCLNKSLTDAEKIIFISKVGIFTDNLSINNFPGTLRDLAMLLLLLKSDSNVANIMDKCMISDIFEKISIIIYISLLDPKTLDESTLNDLFSNITYAKDLIKFWINITSMEPSQYKDGLQISDRIKLGI